MEIVRTDREDFNKSPFYLYDDKNMLQLYETVPRLLI
jgi:hypothetical protein